MNHSVYFFLSFTAIMLLGVFKLILNLRTFSEEEKLFKQYCTRFQTFVSEPEKEEAASDLDWLIKHSEPIGVLLGEYGIAYHPNFGACSIPIHLVPDLCYDLVGFSLAPALDEERFRTIFTCLGRFEGVLNQRRKAIFRKLKNPFSWLAEGVKTILSIPVIALESFGLIDSNSSIKAIESNYMSVVSGIASIITIICFAYELFLHFT